MILPCLRILTALEDILGSLGPQVNQLIAKALNLEQNKEGASNVMLENPDVACILDMVKEKLQGQMVAGKNTKFVFFSRISTLQPFLFEQRFARGVQAGRCPRGHRPPYPHPALFHEETPTQPANSRGAE